MTNFTDGTHVEFKFNKDRFGNGFIRGIVTSLVPNTGPIYIVEIETSVGIDTSYSCIPVAANLIQEIKND